MNHFALAAASLSLTGASATWTGVFYLRRLLRSRPDTPHPSPPREHCGEMKPAFFEHSQRTECVLRPGHTGSHADEHGARWWLTPGTVEDGMVCEAYRLPTSSEDSGLCARCGMSDYKHTEKRHA